MESGTEKEIVIEKVKVEELASDVTVAVDGRRRVRVRVSLG
jgi:hypothetical protein